MGERNSERPDECKEASVGQSRFLTNGIEDKKLSACGGVCIGSLILYLLLPSIPNQDHLPHTPLCLFIH